eukprot:15469792-Alexandrium_andersonii.AAC.1
MKRIDSEPNTLFSSFQSGEHLVEYAGDGVITVVPLLIVRPGVRALVRALLVSVVGGFGGAAAL